MPDLSLWDPCPYPFPRAWQKEAAPLTLHALRSGRRGLVVAATGAGKSGFVSAIVRDCLRGMGRKGATGWSIVILVPTKRLVIQTAKELRKWIGGGIGVFYGEKKEPNADVIVACNPSALNLAAAIKEQGRRVALLILDEAHNSEAETVTAGVEAMNPRTLFGLTATPYRGVRKETLHFFDEVIYTYTPGQAFADGVLVPPRIIGPGGCEIGPHGRAVDDWMAEAILAETEGPGVVNATSTADAEYYADYLTKRGIPSLHIDGYMPDREADSRLDRLFAGELRSLVHCDLLKEGVDFPDLMWLGLRRDSMSDIRAVQEPGRVMRSAPGKDHCVILDPFQQMRWPNTAKIGQAFDEFFDRAAGEIATVGTVADTDRPPALVRACDEVSTWIESMRLTLEMHALIEARKPHQQQREWRLEEPTDKQLDALDRACGKQGGTRFLPEEHRKRVRKIIRGRIAGAADGVLGVGLRRLSRGAANDLAEILFALRRSGARHYSLAKRTGRSWDLHWKLPCSLPPPPGEALELLTKKPRTQKVRG